MKASVFTSALVVAMLTLAGPAAAQDAQPERGQRDAGQGGPDRPHRARDGQRRGADGEGQGPGRQARERANQGDDAQRRRLRRLARQFRDLPQNERQRLRELYQRVRENRSPEDLERLRDTLRQRREAQGETSLDTLQQRRQQFQQRPEEQRQRYRKLMERLVERLPEDERAALEQLPPDERRAQVRALIHAHRQRAAQRITRNLPEDVRREALDGLDELQGRERTRALRQRMGRYARQRVAEVVNDPNLTPEERQARVRAVMEEIVPNRRMREQLMRDMRSGRRAPGTNRREQRGDGRSDRPTDQSGDQQRRRRARDGQDAQGGERPGRGGGRARDRSNRF